MLHRLVVLGIGILGPLALACSDPSSPLEDGTGGAGSSVNGGIGGGGGTARSGQDGAGGAIDPIHGAKGGGGGSAGTGQGAGGEKAGQAGVGENGSAGAKTGRGGANAGGTRSDAGAKAGDGQVGQAGGSAGIGGTKPESGLEGGSPLGADGGPTARDGSASGGLPCGPALPAITDYAATGPFATTTDSNVGPNGKCVVFRPKTLGENGFLHSPIVFGPGIGMQATQLKDLLLSFASHGFVVIGTDVLNGGPNDPENKAAMQNALDWLLQQNAKAGTYQDKLNVKCAVSMGYSVGGTAAVEVGGHEAVATTVSIHGHVATSAMHGPLLQTSGDKDTVGRPMQQQTFDKSQVPTFFGTVSGADHGYIQQNKGGAERVAIIAWLRYWINGDTGAKRYFWGDDCVACVSPWMEPKRKNWQ